MFTFNEPRKRSSSAAHQRGCCVRGDIGAAPEIRLGKWNDHNLFQRQLPHRPLSLAVLLYPQVSRQIWQSWCRDAAIKPSSSVCEYSTVSTIYSTVNQLCTSTEDPLYATVNKTAAVKERSAQNLWHGQSYALGKALSLLACCWH